MPEVLDFAEDFASIYAGREGVFGAFQLSGVVSENGKVGGNAKTVHRGITVEDWRRHLAGKTGVGIVPIRLDSTVRWGAIDVDIYPLDLTELAAKVAQASIPALVIRTKSGGAHVTVYGKEDIPAALMRSKLMQIAVALGYPGVEIFPKQVRLASDKDIGNWLNMPYFGGDDSNRCALRPDGSKMTVAEFVAEVRAIAVDAATLERLGVSGGTSFEDGPPCLQIVAEAGLPPGTRNDAMFAIGVYCRKKYPDQWEEELEKLNQSLCSPPLASGELQTIIKSLKRKTYAYPCSKKPCVNFCNKEVCRSREFGVGQLPDELNVSLGGLVKIAHKDSPSWIIDVDGVRFHISTDELMKQPMFQKVCIERTNKWPCTIKQGEWIRLISSKLENVEVVVPPEDSSDTGQFLDLVTSYITTTPKADVKDEILLGKPWQDDGGFVWFRSSDLFMYLERRGFKKVTSKKAWDVLKEVGGKHDRIYLNGLQTRVWGVPAKAGPTKGFDLPKFRDPEF